MNKTARFGPCCFCKGDIMETSVNMNIIARIYTGFPEKFGLPRQSGLAKSLKGKIVFEREYRNEAAFRGLEEFSHIWILWHFSRSEKEIWSPTVRPPRLGGNTRVGVFATRSPFRPNPIGLSAVRLEKITYEKIEGPVLWVSGVDMADGTPIFDIKPYLAFADSCPEASGGFADAVFAEGLDVEFAGDIAQKLPQEILIPLSEVLAGDPRPHYQKDPERIYGFEFSDYEIKFQVSGGRLIVISAEKLPL